MSADNIADKHSDSIKLGFKSTNRKFKCSLLSDVGFRIW